ncbi:MAG: TRAM domain-containing protein [Acidobacteriota bacterium]
MAELRPGDSVEAVIERVVPGGEGLARIGGVVTLVSGALPGDRVRVRVTESSPRLIRAVLEEVVAAGEARRPDGELCPRARDASCGGCDWPAVRLEAHRALKTALVLDALRRIAGIRPEELPEPGWRGSPRNYRLRNRLHFDREGRLGFFAPRSRVVANLEVCEIVSRTLLARLPAIREHLSGLGSAEGELRTLEDREGKTLLGELRLDEGQDLKISSKGEEKQRAGRGPFDGFRVVAADGRVLFSDGPDSLPIAAGGASFDVGVSCFFQGNLFLLDEFLEEIRTALRAGREDFLRKEEGSQLPLRAVDLYAGVGFMTRPLLEFAAEVRSAAGCAVEVTAVEIDKTSSHSLSKNLQAWHEEGLPLARAVRASAESFLSSLSSQKSPLPLSLLLADPPRAGLSPEVRKGILRLAPRRLLMVSCDPPTLARDLAALKSRYAVERLTLLDLFPQTHHVETIALLARRKVG